MAMYGEINKKQSFYKGHTWSYGSVLEEKCPHNCWLLHWPLWHRDPFYANDNVVGGNVYGTFKKLTLCNMIG